MNGCKTAHAARAAIVDEFVTLLAIPNIAADRANIQRNAETIAKMMEKRGVASKLVTVPDANPVVFGEIKTSGATRTVVFYAHYDGQPLDPKEWATPPFTPTKVSASTGQLCSRGGSALGRSAGWRM
jgi:acetylornithine deacetylase/succinyl-diaminopimelate desuccinylase-like protein